MVEVVGLERKGHVALITLNRPEARNALSPEMLVRLADTWTKVREVAPVLRTVWRLG